jgi:hypothetical protein
MKNVRTDYSIAVCRRVILTCFLKQLDKKDVEWIHVAQGKWRGPVNSISVSIICREFLDQLRTINV